MIVISGNDRGKTGEVIKVIPDKQRVLVKGVNMVKRHQRPSQKSPKGGIQEKEAPIHLSNVMLFDEKVGKGSPGPLARSCEDEKAPRSGSASRAVRSSNTRLSALRA